MALSVRIIMLLGCVLDRDDDDFIGGDIHLVIDEIRVSARNQLAHAFYVLQSPCIWKLCQGLHAVENRGAHAGRAARATRPQIVTDCCEVLSRALRKAQLHLSKRRKAASTSASVANSRRRACASPSKTAGKCAG